MAAGHRDALLSGLCGALGSAFGKAGFGDVSAYNGAHGSIVVLIFRAAFVGVMLIFNAGYGRFGLVRVRVRGRDRVWARLRARGRDKVGRVCCLPFHAMRTSTSDAQLLHAQYASDLFLSSNRHAVGVCIRIFRHLG